MRVALLIFLLSVNCYSQNYYQLLKSSGKKLAVRRTIVVKPSQVRLAEIAIERQTKRAYVKAVPKGIGITADYSKKVVRPEDFAGGHNYLKLAGRKLGNLGFKVSTTYNGAHHILTKSVICKIAGHKTHILNNAPCIFSELHRNPQYEDIFHNHERIENIYNRLGVKGVILDFFSRINKAHEAEGFPVYKQEVIDTELVEAELWAKYWGLKWE